MKLQTLLLAGLLLTTQYLSTTVQGETIELDPGSFLFIYIVESGEGGLIGGSGQDISSPGLMAASVAQGFPFVFPCPNAGICGRAGDLVNISLDAGVGPDRNRIGDVGCDNDEGIPDGCIAEMEFHITASPVKIPGGDRPSFTFSIPFIMTGSAFITGGVETGTASINFRGSGVATLTLARAIIDGSPVYVSFSGYPGVEVFPHVTYVIQPTAVPEPATMLLLGTGLAGIGGVIRRKRQGKEK